MKVVGIDTVNSMYSKQSGLYGIYIPKANKYIYIGKGNNLGKRAKSSLTERIGQSERRFRDWFSFDKFEWHFWVMNNSDKDILEPYLIDKHRPLLNSQFIWDTQSTLNLDSMISPPDVYPFTYTDNYWMGKKCGFRFNFFLENSSITEETHNRLISI